MKAYNAKHPYEPDWQIPRGVRANPLIVCSAGLLRKAIRYNISGTSQFFPGFASTHVSRLVNICFVPCVFVFSHFFYRFSTFF